MLILIWLRYLPRASLLDAFPIPICNKRHPILIASSPAKSPSTSSWSHISQILILIRQEALTYLEAKPNLGVEAPSKTTKAAFSATSPKMLMPMSLLLWSPPKQVELPDERGPKSM